MPFPQALQHQHSVREKPFRGRVFQVELPDLSPRIRPVSEVGIVPLSTAADSFGVDYRDPVLLGDLHEAHEKVRKINELRLRLISDGTPHQIARFIQKLNRALANNIEQLKMLAEQERYITGVVILSRNLKLSAQLQVHDDVSPDLTKRRLVLSSSPYRQGLKAHQLGQLGVLHSQELTLVLDQHRNGLNPFSDNQDKDIITNKTGLTSAALFSANKALKKAPSHWKTKERKESQVELDQKQRLTAVPKGLSLKAEGFWEKAAAPGLYRDGSIYFIVISDDSEMSPVIRTEKELFTQTISSASSDFEVLMNGNMYGVSSSGKWSALTGTNTPIEASKTTPEGQVIKNNQLEVGTSEPLMFYLAKKKEYSFGFGNPPSDSNSAMGGLGPIIIDGLRYGDGNQYSHDAPEGAPATGDPGDKYRKYLIQRNNSTYTSFSKLSARTGKAVIAHSRKEGKIMILMQPDGVSVGTSFNQIRDQLFDLGINDAVFLDGSDSVTLNVKGNMLISPGENKNQLTTTGIGFSVNE